MARRRLDTSDETERVTVRLPRSKLALIDSSLGERQTRSDWFRVMVDAALETPGDPPEMVAVMDAQATDDNPGVRTHLHRPGSKEVAQRTVKGVTTITYECGEDGCTVPLERTR